MSKWGVDEEIFTPEDTTEEETHEENQVETEEGTAEEEAETQETSEGTEQKKDTETGKKYAGKYDTKSGLYKGCDNLAAALGIEPDFDSMTVKEVEEWYVENQQVFYEKGPQQPKDVIKKKAKEIDEATKIDALSEKFDKFIDKQSKPAPKQAEETEPDDFDGEQYSELLVTNPKAAAKMLKDYMQKTVNAEAKKLMPHIQKITNHVNAQEAEKEDKKAWDSAVTTTDKWIVEHGDRDLKEYWPVMQEILQEDPDYVRYLTDIKGMTKDQVIFDYYKRAKKLKEPQTKKAALEKEKDTAAKGKEKEVKEQIESMKAAAGANQGQGNSSSKGSKDPHEEAFHREMNMNKPKNSWAIDE